MFTRFTVFIALLALGQTSQESAQRTAMKNATDNAGEMLNVLRRTFNRARQARPAVFFGGELLSSGSRQ